jgi:exonuclease VII small subunit
VSAELEAAVRELEQAARELRSPEVETARAAELVDRCAEIAAEIGKELDRAARDAERDLPGTGQERLL